MEAKVKEQYLIIKICCVIASFVLWLYIFNVENPMMDRNITVPVQVVNQDILAQSKLVPTAEEQLSVNLTIRGNASDVYSAKSDNFKLDSDLSAYVMKKGENKIPVEVKKSPDNIRIVNIDNLWVKVTLDDLKQKKVPIKISLDGKAKEGYFALKPILKTEEAQVSGPATVIDNVNSVGLKYDVNGSTKDMNVTLPLQPQNYSGGIIKGVEVEPNSVQVIIPIKKIKTVPINVKVQGDLNNGGTVKSVTPIPTTVDIAGEESVISKIGSIDTETIDISKIDNKDIVEAKLTVPKNVTLVNSNGIIKLKMELNKGVQKDLNLDIQTRNIGNNYNATLSSDKVVVTVAGPEDVVNNLKPEDIECFVDLNSLSEGQQTVNVNINLPQGVSKVSQNPSSIVVNISKKISEEKNVSQSK